MTSRVRLRSGRVYAYVVLVLALALLLTTWSLAEFGLPSWSVFAFFWAVHSLAVLDRVEVPVTRMALVREDKPRGVNLSPGFAVLMTVAFAGSVPTALLVALVPAVPALLKRTDRDVTKLVFNSAQECIYTGLAAIFFDSIQELTASGLALFLAAAIASVVALSVNSALVAGVISLERKVAIDEVLRRMTWTIPHSIVFGLVALLIAGAFNSFGPLGACFLFLPLAAMRFARHSKVSLDASKEEALMEFVRAVDAKDPYTVRHSERVAAICVDLHRELGTPDSHLERRWMGALLHDIGKVAVRSEVLGKPGALTAEEFVEIQLHPVLGADVVETIDSLSDLANEIRFHHERIDGKGYPSGLSGDNIPFSARVLAVADAFEALTSDRPYRRALSSQAALDVIWSSAGAQHDRTVVSALNAILSSGTALDGWVEVKPRLEEAIGQ